MKFYKQKAKLSLILLLISGVIVISWIAHSTDKTMRVELLQQARIAARAISVDHISSLTASEKDITTSGYQRIKSQLALMRKARHKAKFLYLMGKSSGDNVYFFVDSLPPTSEHYALPGLVYNEVPGSYLSVFNTRTEAVVGPFTDRWGILVTALIPIISPDSGQLLAVLGMDIEADKWNQEIITRCIGPSLVMLLMLVLIFLLTSRENILAELKTSEEKLRNIVENTSNLFYVHTVDHQLTYVSPRCRDFLQCEPEDAMINWNKFATDNPINDTGFGLVQKAIDTGVRQPPYELELVGTKGKKIRVEVSEMPVLKNNKVISIVGALTDITERKIAEKRSRESEEKYRTYINFSPLGIFIADGTGTYIDVNRAACEMLGYTKQELLSFSIPDIEKTDSGESVENSFQTLKHTGCVNSEKKLLKKDGSFLEVNLIAVPIGDDKYMAFCLDLTEKKKLERQLRQTQKLEAIGTLAGGIAHDFNNILSAILGYTELAMEEAGKNTLLEEFLQEIYIGGQRARDLVKQILAFARQSNQERRPMRLQNIGKEALNLIRATLPATIEIKKHFKSSSLIMGNATEIHQIFINLSTNAAQSMEKQGGTLEIQLKDTDIDQKSHGVQLGLNPGRYSKLSVSDTGHGIAPEIIESVFEPYFTTKEVGKGSGMGLSLVHSIVESYGGKIFVESEPGKGTVFTVYLPVTDQIEYYKSCEVEKLPTGTERILFVDDETSIIKMGKRVLELLGYQVSTSSVSLEALELFRAKPTEFDLVISDMTMPGLPGDILATKLLQIRSDIPIIICTGYSDRITDETAAEIGIKEFIYKPVMKKDLSKVVRKVLDGVNVP